MGLILHKGSSTNSGYYLSMVKAGDIWFECDDVKINKIEFNHFCNSNTVYMLFYKRSTWWKHLRVIGLVPMDATCWVSWEEGIKTLYSTDSSWRPPSMLTFIYFCYLFLFFGLCLLLLLVSLDIDPVLLVLELHMKYTVELYVCIVCGLLSCDSNLYVRSVGHVFAYLYTFDDDLECPMDYETSLLLNVFPPCLQWQPFPNFAHIKLSCKFFGSVLGSTTGEVMLFRYPLLLTVCKYHHPHQYY